MGRKQKTIEVHLTEESKEQKINELKDEVFSKEFGILLDYIAQEKKIMDKVDEKGMMSIIEEIDTVLDNHFSQYDDSSRVALNIFIRANGLLYDLLAVDYIDMKKQLGEYSKR